MTDDRPVLSDADEIRLLREIEERARVLCASADPLMRGQYQHLAGRVTALLAIKGEDVG
ncbi:hypothetical protein EDC65_4403 [Stella humosa]|uniref:Uncharacterized protein n=1 Tax=Stella humosa TaxID=94 RepID=A0A3N1KUU3_9PROT|nr:hypothetical protein [Stella humosa]ROP83754.1 hypothetical protein EDC65_4403 [Stella humosa]BBK32985.1 hypothetical protein STHU_36190 [Stella humosa]